MCYKIMFSLVICASIVAFAQALGSCPNVFSVSNFNPTKLIGKWKNIARTYEKCTNHHRCLTYTISSAIEGMSNDVRIESQGAFSFFGGQKTDDGHVTFQGTGQDLHVIMKLGSCGTRAYHVTYWDPSETTLVLFACGNAAYSRSHAMVLASSFATHEAIDNAEHALLHHGFSKLFLFRREDEGCRDEHL